jgi:hypothetical protein
MQLVVYYEVPNGKREEVKQEFNNFVRNQMVFFKQSYSIFIHK